MKHIDRCTAISGKVSTILSLGLVLVCCTGCIVRLDSRTPSVRFSTYPGLYQSETAVSVELTCPKDARIFYTLDGSKPSKRSIRYTSPITLTRTTTVRTVAYGPSGPSPMNEGTFTFVDTFPTYNLKDTGPAGGDVFYDKGNYDGGWRYLEAAPRSTEWKGVVWMNGDLRVGGCSGEDIGQGLSNTQRIMDYLGDSDFRNPCAATRCWKLEVPYGGTTYGDWFLPSGKELLQLYDVLQDQYHKYTATEAIPYNTVRHWSSSEYSSEGACAVEFLNDEALSGDALFNAYKLNPYSVRAIRMF